jgi:hypothetical protein
MCALPCSTYSSTLDTLAGPSSPELAALPSCPYHKHPTSPSIALLCSDPWFPNAHSPHPHTHTHTLSILFHPTCATPPHTLPRHPGAHLMYLRLSQVHDPVLTQGGHHLLNLGVILSQGSAQVWGGTSRHEGHRSNLNQQHCGCAPPDLHRRLDLVNPTPHAP